MDGTPHLCTGWRLHGARRFTRETNTNSPTKGVPRYFEAEGEAEAAQPAWKEAHDAGWRSLDRVVKLRSCVRFDGAEWLVVQV